MNHYLLMIFLLSSCQNRKDEYLGLGVIELLQVMIDVSEYERNQ